MTKFALDRIRVERKALTAQKMELRLPHLPPSTNHLYLNVPNRGRVKTRAYEDWIFQAGLMLNRQIEGRFTGRVDILIEIEDAHQNRDASNTIKPLEDLLVKCGVIEDDRAKYVRSVKAQWANIEGVRITVEAANG